MDFLIPFEAFCLKFSYFLNSKLLISEEWLNWENNLLNFIITYLLFDKISHTNNISSFDVYFSRLDSRRNSSICLVQSTHNLQIDVSSPKGNFQKKNHVILHILEKLCIWVNYWILPGSYFSHVHPTYYTFRNDKLRIFIRQNNVRYVIL